MILCCVSRHKADEKQNLTKEESKKDECSGNVIFRGIQSANGKHAYASDEPDILRNRGQLAGKSGQNGRKCAANCKTAKKAESEHLSCAGINEWKEMCRNAEN